MTGASAVTALVLLEWTVGLLAAAAWTQSWSVVRRGHFVIVAWCGLGLGVLAFLAARAPLEEAPGTSAAPVGLVLACAGGALCYLLVQYARTDVPGAVLGAATGVLGAVALSVLASSLEGWPSALAALELLAGAALLGAVTNGMLLGHWYLNQPGLKPWALGRLTTLALAATGAAAALGLVATPRLARAPADVLFGLPGVSSSLGPVLFALWIGLVVFTGVVVWMARRCVAIRSIQSATGLYYVALLTAGVSEFLVRYMMVSAT